MKLHLGETTTNPASTVRGRLVSAAFSSSTQRNAGIWEADQTVVGLCREVHFPYIRVRTALLTGKSSPSDLTGSSALQALSAAAPGQPSRLYDRSEYPTPRSSAGVSRTCRPHCPWLQRAQGPVRTQSAPGTQLCHCPRARRPDPV